MSNPFIGEIRAFGFNFAPRGWAVCNGQLLALSQNTALFSILGTFYGGNGTTNFGLPNLQSRAPIGAQGGNAGSGLSPYSVGEQGGSESVAVLSNQMPSHTHTVNGATLPYVAANYASTPSAGNSWASQLHDQSNQALKVYTPGNPATPVNMHAASLSLIGGNIPHENRQPYLAVTFCICMSGVFPSRN